MSDGFDFKELDNFSRDLLAASKDFENGKHAKSFMRKAGNKLKRRTLKSAKAKVNKRTGNLFKGIKRGKPYRYAIDDSIAVRVYAGSPAHHAHLLNNGHRIVVKGKEVGFAKGHHFFEDGAKAYNGEFEGDVNKFLDELLDKHGM